MKKHIHLIGCIFMAVNSLVMLVLSEYVLSQTSMILSFLFMNAHKDSITRKVDIRMDGNKLIEIIEKERKEKNDVK